MSDPVKAITVSELITFLQEQDQAAHVAYLSCSEQCLLNLEDIDIKELCKPRNDGWIHDERPDKVAVKYLVFPGN